MNKPPQVKTGFAANIKQELKNVTWPTRQQSIKLTLTVIVISLIVGIYIGIIDVAFAKILEILTNISN